MLLLLKLTTGDEILGDVQNQDDSEYVIDNPLKVIYQFKPGGRTPVVFLHQVSSFGECKSMRFAKSHVVYTANPKKGLDKYYQEMLEELDLADKQMEQDLLEDTQGVENTTKEDIMNMVLNRIPQTGNTSIH